ncbi:MAG: hypothetical protein BJ554DRAFT_4548 [Olpidium bornovanus]|uniref:PH domain-containing protein n=1 Tax=Olpidium bornovanus TaxID=278681 RepID=A0A8H7ZLZ8_9FUNG|nr:MAG: hypothetical protein BJ554DRAFT_4548 [Olpidium bornovanus]
MLTSWWKRVKDDAAEQDQNDDGDGGDDNSERASRRTFRAGEGCSESGERPEAERTPSSPPPPEDLVSFRIRHVARGCWVTATVPRSCRVCKLVETAVARCDDDQLCVGGRTRADAEANDREPRTDGAGRHRRRHSWFMTIAPPAPALNAPPLPAFARHEPPHVGKEEHSGHWLDESRTLASYHLDPTVDILELQLRRRFVRVSYARGHLGDNYAEGHLLRLHRGGRHGDVARAVSWKRRWFVLSKGKLECHKNEKSFDTSALARVTTPVLHDESHPVERHVMSLVFVDLADGCPAATSVVLRAETAADFVRWMRIFRSIASENLSSSSCAVPPSPSSSLPPLVGRASPYLAADPESDASSAAGVRAAPLISRRTPSERGGRPRDREPGTRVAAGGRAAQRTAPGRLRQPPAGQDEEGRRRRVLLGTSDCDVVTDGFQAAMARERTRRKLVGPLAW